MILEATRAVTDWLDDATYGLQARLTALDFDGSDTAPSGTLTIADETRDAQAALGRFPALPACTVSAQPVESLDGQAATYTHDADIPLLIRLARKDSAVEDATRDLYYTLRAAMATLEALFDDRVVDHSARRIRNGVQLQHIVAMGGARTREELQDTDVTAAIAVTIRCRDLNA